MESSGYSNEDWNIYFTAKIFASAFFNGTCFPPGVCNVRTVLNKCFVDTKFRLDAGFVDSLFIMLSVDDISADKVGRATFKILSVCKKEDVEEFELRFLLTSKTEEVLRCVNCNMKREHLIALICNHIDAKRITSYMLSSKRFSKNQLPMILKNEERDEEQDEERNMYPKTLCKKIVATVSILFDAASVLGAMVVDEVSDQMSDLKICSKPSLSAEFNSASSSEIKDECPDKDILEEEPDISEEKPGASR